jgi:uncharacterized DUF497 family protein
MEFEADPVKAAQNFKKHKVSFEEAASIFGDSMELTFTDPDHYYWRDALADVRNVRQGASSCSDLHGATGQDSLGQCTSSYET